MNIVEQKTWLVILAALERLDPQRLGTCIDVGAGDDHYYFEWLYNLGWANTVVVEPLPNEDVKRLCNQYRLRLIEKALDIRVTPLKAVMFSTGNGVNSLLPIWGNEYHINPVEVTTLWGLMGELEDPPLALLKLDIEGAEPRMIRDLHNIRLPLVVSFEFGGHGTLGSRTGGWQETALWDLREGLDRMASLGYHDAYLIAEVDGQEAMCRRFDPRSQRWPFEDAMVWGNIVALRQFVNPHDLLEASLGEMRYRP